ncbi:UbiX family flavin prenyltransferase [Desulfoferula mesophila]|uniref:Flavin prenyltransferase UbiX n=1 Tax=Desulfoferula mesophila TaxID=3058419 RepID=A0AAU9ENS8_9BACT|nr:flavin prenyltransferase UbiX [Desulfoferula mesophilus]
MADNAKPIIVGITGASGVIYGVRLLEVLKQLGYETHLIMSDAARLNLTIETKYHPKQVEGLADKVYPVGDMAAAVSSGSFLTEGMVIAPCTIKTLSAVANSFNYNLIVRAADVCLKERRRVVLMVRETPLHAGHLRLMTQAVEIGATILPPIPAYYHGPQSIADLIDQSVGKVLDCFGIQHQLFRRWS